ncbi:hypothetical protein IU501_15065 [Nocardia otitidiscaviarum]|uniref:hypothetical protein n=1 Tax=Nocardia otitidiscaviarum TaxID=1823 RepID=UPI0018951C94|nr:hypothetical protein [Nocardia otitidiscaviarum]MBF6134316.1 hypothetical protein [Nocardia otitidiscaviarum]
MTALLAIISALLAVLTPSGPVVTDLLCAQWPHACAPAPIRPAPAVPDTPPPYPAPDGMEL